VFGGWFNASSGTLTSPWFDVVGYRDPGSLFPTYGSFPWERSDAWLASMRPRLMPRYGLRTLRYTWQISLPDPSAFVRLTFDAFSNPDGSDSSDQLCSVYWTNVIEVSQYCFKCGR